VSIFESGVRDGRRTVGVGLVSGVADAERVRRPVDRIGRAARTADGSRGAIAEMFLAIARLVFPVFLLVIAAAAALIYGNESAPWLGDIDVGAKPFDTGLLALPLTLFVVQLTNRRYGAAYAFVQVLGAVAAIIAAVIYVNDDLTLLRGAPLPAPRFVGAFGAGLIVAQLLSIFVFDRLRGPRWWQAPLFASLLGGIALALVAYPAAYLGTGADWFSPMMAYIGFMMAASIVLLVPYWLLRGLIAPLPGFGGY
jgi:queuosine precursor transporter